jgi:hypothetical protein
MRRGNLIMLSGYLQSGKDTVGEYLCANYGFFRVAFADCLKDEVADQYQLPRSDLDTPSGKAKIDPATGETFRDLLIQHGQMRRSEDPNYWIQRVLQRLKESKRTRIVITDWRFPNEHQVMRGAVGDTMHMSTWRVNRWEQPPLQDETEVALDDYCFDHVVSNLGDKAALHQAVTEVVGGHLKLRGYFLVDVDDVLLAWLPSFTKYLHERGYKTTHSVPQVWDMCGWLLSGEGGALSGVEVRRLILDFNHSADFGALDPVAGSVEALDFIKSAGFYVVAVTSCTDQPQATIRRDDNLQRWFPSLIDEVHCLELGANKRKILAKYPPSIWVDDHVVNAACGKDLGHHSILFQRDGNASPTEHAHIMKAESWQGIISHLKRTYMEVL